MRNDVGIVDMVGYVIIQSIVENAAIMVIPMIMIIFFQKRNITLRVIVRIFYKTAGGNSGGRNETM